MRPSRVNVFARIDQLLSQPTSQSRDVAVNQILEHQAQVAGFGISPIVLAARNSHIGAMRFLLDRGADANSSANGRPVLHTAVESDAEAIVQLLIERGCDVNRVDFFRSEMTALRIAVLRRNNAMLALLVRHGAVLSANDLFDTSRMSHETLRLLLMAGFDVELAAVPRFLLDVSTDDEIGLIRLLLAHGSSMSMHKTGFASCRCPRIGALLQVAGVSVPMHSSVMQSGDIDKCLDWAKRELNRERLALISARATLIVIAMQALDLPALLLVMIIDVACQPLASCVSMHAKWQLVTAVKHARPMSKF